MESKTTGRASGHHPANSGANAHAVAYPHPPFRPIGTQYQDMPACGPGTWQRQGLLLGTLVLTLDGEMPVEHLTIGDRIITRDTGTAVLRGIRALPHHGPTIRVADGSLGHHRPGRPARVLPGQKILIRDWRGPAFFGCAQAMVPAAALVDGQFVTEEARTAGISFTLLFDHPHVIYAAGLELGIETRLDAA